MSAPTESPRRRSATVKSTGEFGMTHYSKMTSVCLPDPNGFSDGHPLFIENHWVDQRVMITGFPGAVISLSPGSRIHFVRIKCNRTPRWLMWSVEGVAMLSSKEKE